VCFSQALGIDVRQVYARNITRFDGLTRRGVMSYKIIDT